MSVSINRFLQTEHNDSGYVHIRSALGDVWNISFQRHILRKWGVGEASCVVGSGLAARRLCCSNLKAASRRTLAISMLKLLFTMLLSSEFNCELLSEQFCAFTDISSEGATSVLVTTVRKAFSEIFGWNVTLD